MVLEEQAHVGDGVAQHGDALQAHSQRKTGPFFGIDAAVLEHHRMNHSAAQDLDPPGLLAQVASAPLAEHASDVDLRTGLDEREVAWTKAHRRAGPVEPLRELRQDALEVRHGDVLVDEEGLDLVKHRRVRHVVVAAIHAARRDEGHGRLVRGHGANLHVAGVRSQKVPGGGPEAVLHVRGRVIGRKAELREVVLLQLHVRTVMHGEAEAAEDGDDLLAHDGDGMLVTERRQRAPGQREIERWRVEISLSFRQVEGAKTAGECSFYLLLDLINLEAEGFTIDWREAPHPLHEDSELPFLAERLCVLIAKLLLRGRCRKKT